jgi:transcriptional regulator with XRE-family HTH domain|tara:strand:+ start:611 stop:841 length:231 start_codon:yes stop_codon:yes gene_type:complete
MTRSIDELCKEHKLTVQDLIEKTGIDDHRVMAICMSRWTPSPEDRKKIAEAFELEVDDITWGHVTPIQHIYGHGPG